MALAVLNRVIKARFSPGAVGHDRRRRRAVVRAGSTPRRSCAAIFDGDWGDLSDSDRRQNDAALKSGEDRLFSSYQVTPA